MRDEDSATYRSCAFVGNFAAMALGTHSGEVRLHDTLSGDLIDTIDAHESPVYQLRVSATSCSLQTSSLQLSCTCFHSKISAVVLNDADMLPSCVGHDSCSPEAALQKLRFVRRTTFPACMHARFPLTIARCVDQCFCRRALHGTHHFPSKVGNRSEKDMCRCMRAAGAQCCSHPVGPRPSCGTWARAGVAQKPCGRLMRPSAIPCTCLRACATPSSARTAFW